MAGRHAAPFAYNTPDPPHTLSPRASQPSSARAPPRIEPAYGYVWPSLYSRMNAVEVNYTAGATSPLLVSDTIKLAIKMLVAHWYESREPIITGTIVAMVPFHIEQLLVNETIPHF